jgi:uncharacterized membrane protein
MGELAGLVAAMIWAGTSIAFTRFAGRTSPAVISALRLGSASLVLPLILLASGEVGDLEAASWQTLAWVVLSGALAYAVGDTLYIRALSLIGMQRTFPITMGLFIALTVVGGIVLLDEDFTWGLPAGAALIGIGISLIVAREDGRPSWARATVTWSLRTSRPAAGRGSLAGHCSSCWWGSLGRGKPRPRGKRAILAPSPPAFAPRREPWPFWGSRRPSSRRSSRHRSAIGAISGHRLPGSWARASGHALRLRGPRGRAGEGGGAFATAPLMALPLTILFLKERPTRLIAVGTLLCVAGILLVVS